MVTWNERDDAREAFIAGSSGARKNTGTTKDTREAFTRGRTSAKEFRRRGQYKSPEDKRYAPDRKTAATKFTDKTGDIIRDAGGDFMDMIFPAFQKTMQGIGSIGANWKRNKRNEEILEDAYGDEVRKSMMSASDRAFYDKYMKLGDMRSGPEAQYYYKEANKALQNAQITNRINYALGQPEYGFDTTAPAAQAAFGETPDELRERIDYSALAGNLAGGLEGTKSGRKFLSDVIPKGEALRDTGMIGDAAARIADAQKYGKAGFFEPWMNEEASITDTTPAFAYPETDISGGEQTMFEYPYGQLGDPDISAEGEEFLTPTPYNAATLYPNLNFPYIRNRLFPGMELEDITREDISGLSQEDLYGLGYQG